tara:strand:- start:1948 stop:2916 length:969 start_codon:yes stop_codon:yes gene_type:complete
MKSNIFPIVGDASFRSFYRLVINKKTKIIVLAKKEKYKNLLAYLAVNKFLRKNKILAPKLFAQDYDRNIIVIEDFGNLSLYKILLRQKKRFATYKKIINLLLKIQKIKPKTKIEIIKNKKYYLKKYSSKYLNEESDLFFDWYLPLFIRKDKVKKIKKKAKIILSQLYKKLYFPNNCFVHRDYHAQNLMKIGKKIGLIDSQDAIIGNPAYDLVSIVDDVRIKNSIKLKNKIYDYYLKNTLKAYRVNNEEFLQDFNILSVQRSLKIIGIFARLYKRDGKKRYLKIIPYTWKILELRLNSGLFSDLKEILDKNVSKKVRKKIIIK